MKEEFENSKPSNSGIIPAQKEHRNTPKTIHGAAATIFGVQRLADQICADLPKTIHSDGVTTSGDSAPLKKRGRGAPPGNLNALKTGRHTRKGRILRKKMWLFTSQIDALVRMVEAEYGFEVSFRLPRKQNWPVMPEKLRRKYREKARK